MIVCNLNPADESAAGGRAVSLFSIVYGEQIIAYNVTIMP